MNNNENTANQDLLKTNFWSVKRLDQMYYIKWENLSEHEMTTEQFKEHIVSLSKLIESDGVANNVNGFMVDTRLYHFTMNLDIQVWHDEVIIPIYIKSGIVKIAFILSGDLIRDLSIEQTFDEQKAQSGPLDIQYFDNARAAREWVATL
ncbi:hypothetical protein [Flammeovirga pacifica]|uniref:STAS/SEC14 domain-containing protein n=1 Tax=Flammeovirga pacifica TaxID=915059 RepID=A0A1S1YUL5_FLAPC|nr:hypothetical protein [Flammeovirga pacifica]OHX64718.1 hypothetical protein NH26_24455 [Flammeovirga pacifica]